MKPTFNVLTEGWIPVIYPDGRRDELGVLDVLSSAHNLHEISCAETLEEFGAYRFLSIFLMDALRPKKISDIRAMTAAGHFDMAKIQAYTQQCKGEGVTFDLFSDDCPFLQCASMRDSGEQEKPVAELVCTQASGDSHPHFCHNPVKTLTPQRAIRTLITTYLFSTAKAQDYPSSVYGAPPYFSIIRGKNLYETLVNLLIPTDLIDIPFDAPPVLWRRTTDVVPKKHISDTSWLQGMLFPVRKVLLIPNDAGNVVGIYMKQGENCKPENGWRDPHASYLAGKKGPVVYRPKGYAPLWKNVCSIANVPTGLASTALQLYRRLHETGLINMSLYGVETEDAKYIAVHYHDLTFPLQITNQFQNEMLAYCVTAAETVKKNITYALEKLAKFNATEIRNATTAHGSLCEKAFFDACMSLGTANADIHSTYKEYVASICANALTVFDDVVKTANIRASRLADVANARRWLNSKMIKLQKEERK